MSEVKYEAVFGNLDFDDFDLDTAAVCDCGDFLLGITEDELKSRTLSDFRNEPIIAMRRIIKTPVWTVADQKAGRLPEVGWVVMATGVNEDARIAAINNDAVCVVFEDGGFITLHVSGITPIETPEELAQRLWSEWVDNAENKWDQSGAKGGFLEFIYDMQLSGELPPVQAKDGA